ncbi:hypothetical protein AMTRI_Chr13g82550 [Amborella trichopoda]
MKASLKLREGQKPLVRAKIPVSVLGVPFISGIEAGDSEELSLHLRTAWSAGPAIKASYSPNDSWNPFGFVIKSGIGLWGSPERSPLFMAVEFSLLGRASPRFTLQFRPESGDFMVRKSVRSFQAKNPVVFKQNGSFQVGNGGFQVEAERDKEKENINGGFPDIKEVVSGVNLNVRSGFPLRKHAALKLRWGVNFPAKRKSFQQEVAGNGLPYLTVDKISVESVNEEEEEGRAREYCGSWFGFPAPEKEVEFVKGMCFVMRSEVEGLKRENGAMRESIEEMRRFVGGGSNENKKLGMGGEGEERLRKRGEEGVRAGKKTTGNVSEELKKAIKGASGL